MGTDEERQQRLGSQGGLSEEEQRRAQQDAINREREDAERRTRLQQQQKSKERDQRRNEREPANASRIGDRLGEGMPAFTSAPPPRDTRLPGDRDLGDGAREQDSQHDSDLENEGPIIEEMEFEESDLDTDSDNLRNLSEEDRKRINEGFQHPEKFQGIINDFEQNGKKDAAAGIVALLEKVEKFAYRDAEYGYCDGKRTFSGKTIKLELEDGRRIEINGKPITDPIVRALIISKLALERRREANSRALAIIMPRDDELEFQKLGAGLSEEVRAKVLPQGKPDMKAMDDVLNGKIDDEGDRAKLEAMKSLLSKYTTKGGREHMFSNTNASDREKLIGAYKEILRRNQQYQIAYDLLAPEFILEMMRLYEQFAKQEEETMRTIRVPTYLTKYVNAVSKVWEGRKTELYRKLEKSYYALVGGKKRSGVWAQNPYVLLTKYMDPKFMVEKAQELRALQNDLLATDRRRKELENQMAMLRGDRKKEQMQSDDQYVKLGQELQQARRDLEKYDKLQHYLTAVGYHFQETCRREEFNALAK